MSLELEPRPLRCLGRVVSAIGAGCWTIGGPATNRGIPIGWDGVDPDRAYEGLARAYALGVTLFDTADVYGLGASERLLGRLLTSVPRNQVVISSKVGYFAGTAAHPYHPLQMRHQLETTLTNLGSDYLDMYFLHSSDFGLDDRYLDDAVEQMRAFQREGLISAIGMRAPHVFAQERNDASTQRFLRLFNQIRPGVLTVRYNLLSPLYSADETDIFDFAKKQEVDVIIKQPLAQGLLTGTHSPDRPRRTSSSDHRSTDPTFTQHIVQAVHEVLREVVQHFGDQPADLVRVALRYALQRAPDAPVLVGFRDAGQITMSLTSLGDPLAGDAIALLRHLTAPARQMIHDLPARVPQSRPASA
ncbi:aldo/keto reductase [Streptosporangium sp. NPDC020072]|uniref:aldo/keto reductase n=1 Tax=Streptosporangium sp. NPDC020072 TaxID=3154788 RepID=UPI003441CE42